MSGHYVCHIKKDGNWVLFNDTKVAISQNPPKDMGYLYVFRRKDWIKRYIYITSYNVQQNTVG